MVRRLDAPVLRGPRPEGGLRGLVASIGRARGLASEEKRALTFWTERVLHRIDPLVAAMSGGATPIANLLQAHIDAAEALAADAIRGGAARLWAGDAGEAAAGFVADLAEAAPVFPAIDPSRYPSLFEALLQASVVRPRYGRHPRLAILGPLEARLQRADRLILAGLNEGTWPAETTSDPWLSRPMRSTLGLPLPERRIGQSAHDFVQAFAAPELILTRAQRVEGAPTVPSRWLQRIDTTLRALELGDSLRNGAPWLAWQHRLDRPRLVQPIRPPAPCPPIAARPRALSVTDIEIWMRDPYALYARRILDLKALEPIDADPGAAERGTFIHQALDRFVREFPDLLPDNAVDRLLAHGRAAFEPVLQQTAAWAFWWPRFERIARWVVAEEQRRRPGLARILTETKGSMKFAGPAGEFLLSGKADRIEIGRDGAVELIDYKTGSVPAPRDIEAGLSGQLPLEAVMALAGGFPGLAAPRIEGLSHWRLSGGDPPGEVKKINDPAAHIAAARDGIAHLIATFDDPATPYQARPHPAQALRFNDYAHLARIKEWASEEHE
jgi:ATP-dependent helicase/nuclease subunit B